VYLRRYLSVGDADGGTSQRRERRAE